MLFRSLAGHPRPHGNAWSHEDFSSADFGTALQPRDERGTRTIPELRGALMRFGGRIRPNEISRFEPLNRSERLLSRPPGTLSSIRNGGEGWGEEVIRFMGSFDLQRWTRIGAMNRAEHPSPHPSPLLGGGERVPEGRERGGWRGRFMENTNVQREKAISGRISVCNGVLLESAVRRRGWGTRPFLRLRRGGWFACHRIAGMATLRSIS